MAHAKISATLTVEGQKVEVAILDNPNVEDVLVTEARIYVHALSARTTASLSDRQVGRDIRKHVAQLGVEI